MHRAPDADPDVPQNAVPAQTTPTWEMELLVSGATIFGLLQLPDLIDRAYVRTLNLSPDDYAGLLTPLWMYSKFAIITLVVTFVVHLCLRGYWVALVGLDSVYPGGIRWERLERGTIALASSKQAAPPMPAVIERADNRATRVFATGFGFAMVMLMPVALVLLSLLLSVLVDATFGPGHASEVFGAVVAVVLLPWALSRFLDKHIGARLPADGGLHRLLARVMHYSARLGMGRGSNPLVALFVSHEGRWRAGVAAMTLILPVLIVLSVQMSLARGHLPLGFFVGLAAEDPTSADTAANAFYADAADDRATVLPMPRIPSRVADGPYLQLFVPFIPRLHGPALQAACPGALAVAGDGATRARLDCLARLNDLRLDGAPVDVRLDATTDARSGQPGMLAMIPVDGLAAGRHEVSLAAPDNRAGRTPRRYRIPFWK